MRKIRLGEILLLLLAGFLAYSNTFLNSFHLDDAPSIITNAAIKNIHDLGAIWNFWPTRFITYVSLAFNYHFSSLDVFSYHVFNLCVHLGCGLLVWGLALLIFSTPLLKDQKITRHAGLASFLMGMVFLTHPVGTQAVTYIIQRATSMAAFFYLASLSFYLKSRLLEDKQATLGLSRIAYSASLLTALAAMFTKEMTITLPLMILFCEFSFFKAPRRLRWQRLIPFLLILLVIPLTMFLTGSVNLNEMRRITESPLRFPSFYYFLTQLKVIVTYTRLFLLPLNQNLDYNYPTSGSFFEGPTFLSFLFIIFVLGAAFRMRRRYPLVSFGIFWFFITLLPESSIISIRDVIFEHRLYLPLAGYAFFLVSGLFHLFGRKGSRGVVLLLFLLVVCYSGMTYQRNKVWKDDLTLWSDVLKKNPNSALAYHSRGSYFLSKKDYEKAAADLSRSITIAAAADSNIIELSYFNLGLLFYERGENGKARDVFMKLLKLAPKDARAYCSIGNTYANEARHADAVLFYKKAIEIDPGFGPAYNNLGNEYVRLGRFQEAVGFYDKAIQESPDDASAYDNLALLYNYLGKTKEIVLLHEKAVANKAASFDAYYHIAGLYAQKGSNEEAIKLYQEALRINPDSVAAMIDLGNAYCDMGKNKEGILYYEKALKVDKVDPGLAAIHNNLALAYYVEKRYDLAIKHCDKAVTLGYSVNPELLSWLKPYRK